MSYLTKTSRSLSYRYVQRQEENHASRSEGRYEDNVSSKDTANRHRNYLKRTKWKFWSWKV